MRRPNGLEKQLSLVNTIIYREKINSLLPALSPQECGKYLNIDDLEKIWYPYGNK